MQQLALSISGRCCHRTPPPYETLAGCSCPRSSSTPNHHRPVLNVTRSCIGGGIPKHTFISSTAASGRTQLIADRKSPDFSKTGFAEASPFGNRTCRKPDFAGMPVLRASLTRTLSQSVRVVYSVRKAFTGSIEAARRARMIPGTQAATASVHTAAAITPPSCPTTSYSCDCTDL